MSIAMASLSQSNKYQPIHAAGLPDEATLLSQLSGPTVLSTNGGGIPVISGNEVVGVNPPAVGDLLTGSGVSIGQNVVGVGLVGSSSQLVKETLILSH
jgi:hypothetical protein